MGIIWDQNCSVRGVVGSHGQKQQPHSELKLGHRSERELEREQLVIYRCLVRPVGLGLAQGRERLSSA